MQRCLGTPEASLSGFIESLWRLQQSHCLLTARKSICNFIGSFEMCFLGNHILFETLIK